MSESLRWVATPEFPITLHPDAGDWWPRTVKAEVYGPLAVHRPLERSWSQTWAITDVRTGLGFVYVAGKAAARGLVEAMAPHWPVGDADLAAYSVAAEAAFRGACAALGYRPRRVFGAQYINPKDGSEWA